MKKQEIIEKIKDIFRKNPIIEVVVKDLPFRNGRWGLQGYALCYMNGDLFVRPWPSSVCFWWANMNKLKKNELETILERTYEQLN